MSDCETSLKESIASRFNPVRWADGRALSQLDELGEDAWISFVVRESRLVRVAGETRLRAHDELLILAEPANIERLLGVFEGGSDRRPGG